MQKAAPMLFVYVVFALLPGAAAALPIMMSSLPLLGSLENCKEIPHGTASGWARDEVIS